MTRASPVPAEIANVLNTSYDGLAIFDAAGEMLHCFGALFKRVDEQCLATMRQACQDAVRTEQPLSCVTQNEDQSRSLLLTASPVFDGGAGITHVTCNIRDIDDLDLLRREVCCRNGRDNSKPSLIDGLAYQEELKNFITRSVAMERVLATALRVAQVDSTILILGESGVGKGLMARHIQKIGRRKNEPFVKISCGAIPEQLLESELFGYEVGAFTGARKNGKPGLFEIAGSGTIFLDEIAELPLSLQVKLLNVLQDRTFIRVGGVREIATNARIISATNKNLEQLVKAGQFRADLFYRLHVVPVVIPPLRERRGDILILVNHFLDNFGKRHGFSKALDAEAIDCLVKYDWPGNVRELQNVIEYLVVAIQDDIIRKRHLPGNILEEAEPRTTLKDALENYERGFIHDMLLTYGNLKDTADSLGIDTSTLTRKKQKYGLIRNRMADGKYAARSPERLPSNSGTLLNF